LTTVKSHNGGSNAKHSTKVRQQAQLVKNPRTPGLFAMDDAVSGSAKLEERTDPLFFG
jgi:hypothetical protein